MVWPAARVGAGKLQRNTFDRDVLLTDMKTVAMTITSAPALLCRSQHQLVRRSSFRGGLLQYLRQLWYLSQPELLRAMAMKSMTSLNKSRMMVVPLQLLTKNDED